MRFPIGGGPLEPSLYLQPFFIFGPNEGLQIKQAPINKGHLKN